MGSSSETDAAEISAPVSSVAFDDREALSALLARRFSCRAFLPGSVPRPLIEEMLRMAQMAPSWCNSQPWQTYVTSGAATERFRAGLLDYADNHAVDGVPRNPDISFPPNYSGIYKDRQRECGWQLYESVGVAHGDRAGSARQARENFRLFGAPHALVVTSARALGSYGVLDCGAYLGNLLLAAASLGIATVAQAAVAGCAPFVRSFFDLPDDVVVLVGVSFGYADPDHPANGFRTRRAALGDVTHWMDR